ncbi:hypothetical protein [Enterococcus faecium]|uniref:hypothetical protein n=1 Tax=Enterococcus faecium TaxID=1352 RepID=UPI0015E8039B|nr:hypothetical protein [Enterococcus faecium]
MGLLPQMQAFEHRLFGIKGCDTIFVTALLLRINGVQKLASAVISPAKLKTLGAVFTWLFLLLQMQAFEYRLRKRL